MGSIGPSKNRRHPPVDFFREPMSPGSGSYKQLVFLNMGFANPAVPVVGSEITQPAGTYWQANGQGAYSGVTIKYTLNQTFEFFIPSGAQWYFSGGTPNAPALQWVDLFPNAELGIKSFVGRVMVESAGNVDRAAFGLGLYDSANSRFDISSWYHRTTTGNWLPFYAHEGGLGQYPAWASGSPPTSMNGSRTSIWGVTRLSTANQVSAFSHFPEGVTWPASNITTRYPLNVETPHDLILWVGAQPAQTLAADLTVTFGIPQIATVDNGLRL